MSDVTTSIVYVLAQEDPHMTGVITDDPKDSGGRTRFGVAERSHPGLTPSGFYDYMSFNDALKIAEQVYTASYATPMCLSQIVTQKVANALLSFAINEGVESSVKVLQRALALPDDGKFGPATLAAVNTSSPATLLANLSIQQKAHYAAIVAANPNDERFIHGWNNRIDENCEAA